MPWEVEELALPLSERQKQILIGMLLGDGHLEVNGRNTRLKVDHGARQRDLVLWKYAELEALATARPVRVAAADSRSGKVYEHFRFATRTIPELNEYRELFYRDGRKIVPREIGELLTSPLTVAVWYMVDGHRRSDCGALRINTQSYALEEQVLLQDCLAQNFGVRVSIHRVTEGVFVLYVPASEAQKFCDLVRPHTVASMKHKLL